MATPNGYVPPPFPERTGHPFLTYDMIHEIPDAIRKTLEISSNQPWRASQVLKERSDFCYTGCGTAFFSAMLGASILSLIEGAQFRYECVQALELSHYHSPVSRNNVTFGVSHSGITKATLDALTSAKAQGAYCVGITHFPNSPITKVADETVIVGNGPDKSRCHTKCYLAGATALTHIGLELLDQRKAARPEQLQGIRKNLAELPQMASTVLSSTNQRMQELAEKHAEKRTIYFAGTGASYPNALEAALKVMESSYVPAQGFETEQLLHGPLVSLDTESVVFVMATELSTYGRSLDLAKAATSLGSAVIPIVYEGDREMASIYKYTVQIPAIDEHLAPFLSIIPLYLFAYYMCLQHGYNPDYIHYLTPAYWNARQIIFPPGTH
jgi:glucosamine--fructose-6-phosphate aminotransferase (isomerizing)